MKLRKLRVWGFKSFADKTEFEFRDGITVVVGPNGCGKSNVVDAVKWTLGEQSAKSLRGKEMLDVIFNGAVGRKAAALAETTLVFENSHGLLGKEHAVVEVTRRLYRSGESEYLVNKNVVRLRDIKELFMGTGVGVDAYSVIEQGKVDILLASNPQERRLIFEEAAGISRLKAKKKEATRKLDKVQVNLARLADINEEVAKRLRSVKIQAGKARNYQEYAVRLKELRVRWSLAEYHKRSAERDAARAKLEGGKARRAVAEGEFNQVEQARAAAAAELDALDRAAAADRMRRSELGSRIASVEDRLAAARRRSDELHDEAVRDRTALAEGRRACADLLRRAANEQDETAALADRVEAKRLELAAAQDEARGIRRAGEETAERLQREKSDVVEWVRRIAQVSNESIAAGIDRRNLSANRGKLSERAEGLRRDISDHRREREELAAGVATLEGLIARQDRDRLARRNESEALTAKRAQSAEQVDAGRRELNNLESRQTVLRELEAQLEGVDGAVREILRKARDGTLDESAGALRSVRGMVADFVTTGREYVPVIEAALGRHLQSLVVATGAGLLSDLPSLERMSGHAHFFCVDRLPVTHDGLRLDGEPDYVGRPMDFVEVSAEARPVAEHLLAKTIVVRSVEGAIKLAPKVPRGYRFVTLDGQVVGEDGSLELGTPAGRSGLLSRKSELADLDVLVTRARRRVDELETESAELNASAGHLDRLQQDLRTSIYEAATARAEKQAQIERLDQMLAKWTGEEPALTAELAGLDEDLAELDRRLGEISGAVAELDAGRAGAEDRVNATQQQVNDLRARETAVGERISDLRVEVSRVEQQRDSFAEQAQQLIAARKAAEESLEQTAGRIRRSGQRQVEEDRRLLEGEAERAELYLHCESLDAGTHVRVEQRRGLPERVGDLTRRARALGAELAQLTESAHKLEMSCSEVELRVENLITRVRDDYALDLAAEYAKLIDPPLPRESDVVEPIQFKPDPTQLPLFDVGASAECGVRSAESPELNAECGVRSAESEAEQLLLDGLNAEELVARPAPPSAAWLAEHRRLRDLAIADLENTDWSVVQAEINDLKGKIERLGNVNLDSIAELEDLEQRSGWMEKQVADLNDARKQLEDLIARLNKESAELFVVTFAQVRANFQELFRKLFGGGKADVFLEDENSPLDCGIEIVARPPGKEPRSITLLSGGEKTMTAVAMLLAVFRSRPSPFCILDEVDAALDEANTHRFGGVLTEFTDHSQFIVITHRKPTMSVANTMYGVTMQETGVSKKVAVRFDDHGEVVTLGDDGKTGFMTLEGPRVSADAPTEPVAVAAED